MLSQIKVLEFAGLAPTVFIGMVLADYGAQVTLLSRLDSQPQNSPMNRGKKSMTFDLKCKQDIEIVKHMIKDSNVLIDPYRPGVLERLGLSYQVCSKINPKLIYCRVTGFGQNSPLKEKAGHDINFISYGGVLGYCSSTGTQKRPAIPGNVVGDFAAGGMLGVASILAALINVQKGGNGQQIDLGMAQGSAYLSQFILHQKNEKLWSNGIGNNLLDGGTHFYNIYQCKDAKFMSVGCLEEKFYQEFVRGLIAGGLTQQRGQFLLENQLNQTEWENLKSEISTLFESKTRDEWEKIFDQFDACVSPVVELEEYETKKYLGENVFIKRNGKIEVNGQPIFSEYQYQIKDIPKVGQHNNEKPKL
ncbi:unnamed protein product [Paramecium octaurelia]|uniref:Alpha-methylacyl-CoA racemase n=1 Tax=Paramecium octaurelia TaxID=43137 RepID=A0A8S1STJ7_PAROT|nr:unnamed protein product [Paramecium octaurelia]